MDVKEDNNNNNDKIMSSPNKEITEVAAEAMSLQPTGHTLATTQVCPKIFSCALFTNKFSIRNFIGCHPDSFTTTSYIERVSAYWFGLAGHYV
ncbi:unnamed protein product [Clavelina lepadiformis]|uniref:Uncharacterized protein n=1 Tax=Clavelina lepadiformis TaxID=159417 RepID=A0ABP0FQ52_CLALP